MDIRDLAPALLSIAELFEQSSHVLYGQEAPPVRTRIVATGTGSVDVFLEIVQQSLSDILPFGNQSPNAVRALLGHIYIGVTSNFVYGSLAGILKSLRGKKWRPEEIDEQTGVVLIVSGDTRMEVPYPVFQLMSSKHIRDILCKPFDPLRIEGIDKFTVRSRDNEGTHEQIITKEEVDYFVDDAIDDEEEATESRYAATYTIVTLTFKETSEGLRWRLGIGQAEITVLIKDMDFIRQVSSGNLTFGSGDSLECQVLMRQTPRAKTIKTEYIVEKVLRHRPGHRQMELL